MISGDVGNLILGGRQTEKWDLRIAERHDGVACVYGAMGDVAGHRYWAAKPWRAAVDEKGCYPWSKKVWV